MLPHVLGLICAYTLFNAFRVNMGIFVQNILLKEFSQQRQQYVICNMQYDGSRPVF